MHLKISLSEAMSAMQDTVKKNGGCPEIAARIGTAASTLYNKISPYDSEDRRHYLNINEADEIMKMTGDYRFFKAWAARHDFILLPLKVVPDAPTVEQEKLQDLQSLARYQAASTDMERGFALCDLIEDLLQTEILQRGCQGQEAIAQALHTFAEKLETRQ